MVRPLACKTAPRMRRAGTPARRRRSSAASRVPRRLTDRGAGRLGVRDDAGEVDPGPQARAQGRRGGERRLGLRRAVQGHEQAGRPGRRRSPSGARRCGGMSSTGTGERPTTASATLPRMARRAPLRPWVAITTRPASASRTAARIASAGDAANPLSPPAGRPAAPPPRSRPRPRPARPGRPSPPAGRPGPARSPAHAPPRPPSSESRRCRARGRAAPPVRGPSGPAGEPSSGTRTLAMAGGGSGERGRLAPIQGVRCARCHAVTPLRSIMGRPRGREIRGVPGPLAPWSRSPGVPPCSGGDGALPGTAMLRHRQGDGGEASAGVPCAGAGDPLRYAADRAGPAGLPRARSVRSARPGEEEETETSRPPRAHRRTRFAAQTTAPGSWRARRTGATTSGGTTRSRRGGWTPGSTCCAPPAC